MENQSSPIGEIGDKVIIISGANKGRIGCISDYYDNDFKITFINSDWYCYCSLEQFVPYTELAESLYGNR